MNNHQLKQNVINYCKRNGRITYREIKSMMIDVDVINELLDDKSLIEIKLGVYEIPKKVKLE